MQVHRPITVDDLDSLELPERWELIHGEVVEVSPADFWASAIGLRIGGRLEEVARISGKGLAGGADSGFVLDAAKTILLSPDAAFVRRDKLEGLGRVRFLPVAPDIAVEVLSPSDRVAGAMRKISLYLDAGTSLVWFVHPERRTVTVFTQDAAPFTLVGDDAVLDGGDVLPEFRMTLAEIFGN